MCNDVNIGVIADGVYGGVNASRESFVNWAFRIVREVDALRMALRFVVEEVGIGGMFEGEERVEESRERRVRVVESAEVYAV